MRLLIVEDEKQLNSIISERFVNAGYCVDSCRDGENALLYIENAEYDCIILDIMIPKPDGLTVLRTIRGRGLTAPVLLLTAKDSDEDIVNGLDSGANDYLIKPFSFDVLSARIRALIRANNSVSSNIVRIADLTVDFRNRVVERGGRRIELPAKEYAIMEYLIQNKGIVLSKEKLEQHIWNYDYEGGSDVIKVYIHHLRKKIDEGFEIKLIHTIKNMGYVLKEKKQ